MPEPSFRIAGQGRDLFTRAEIRDRIRTGEISGQTELAYENSDDYQPASQFAELARYLALAAAPAAEAAAAAPPRTSVLGRVGPGLIFPFTGIGWIVIVAATLLMAHWSGMIIVAAFTTVYGMAVIRNSSAGATVMPRLSDIGGPSEFIMMLLKWILITLCYSVLCLVVSIPVVFVLRSSTALWVLYVVIMYFFYPAAVATLAKWKNIQAAIRPGQIYNFMRILGADYVVAVVALVFASALVYVVPLGLGLLGLASAQPGLFRLAVHLSLGLVLTWQWFYFCHLIGWGMHRHADEM
ncbi:MAG TPA: hypothetical protein VNA04_01630 [Thermoanaerobaculia bacterium]|nr:hypothetical protein [Thermoanaerobaculia bacterium]